MTYNIDKDYDERLKKELEKHLNRPAKSSELINADKDADIVGEVFWQLFLLLENRIKALEDEVEVLKKKKDKELSTVIK